MQKNLLITGTSGVGKTYILREMLGKQLLNAGGFVTERINTGTGNMFILQPSAAVGGAEGFEKLCFLDYTVSPPKKDNEVFRIQGVKLLSEAHYYPFALLDEFGGYELLIPQFREALLELLNSEIPCIGVIKGIENAKTLQNRFGLGEKYMDMLSQLHLALKSDPDTRLIDMTQRGDCIVATAIKEWMEAYT